MIKSSICIIPVKKYSERIPNKSFVLVNGVPLYQIFITTVAESKVFDKVVVDTDSDDIQYWCERAGVECRHRLPYLATDTANGNMLLRYHVSLYPNFDYYWQGFVTTPYISVATIKTMDSILRAGHQDNDSVMTVKALKGMFWSADGRPISYRPDVMPRSQDIPPIYQEVHGLFGVTAAGFAATRNRAGVRPWFYVLPKEECKDIDWPDDLPANNP